MPTIDINQDGSITVCAIVYDDVFCCERLERMRYYGYNQTEAQDAFIEDINRRHLIIT